MFNRLFKKPEPEPTPAEPESPEPAEESPPPPPAPKFSLKRWLWRWVLMPLLLVFVVFHLLVAGLLWAWQTYPATNSMFMLTHRINGGDVRQTWVDYGEINVSAKQAVIASEDANFVAHNGFDVKSMEKALQTNEKHGKIKKGGSTITQQLAKNLFLTSHRSYIRKTEEAIIALMIEQMWDKERILTVYLNVVEFGNGIYGIEEASKHYFGKSAKNLNREESALLISMLPNPKYYEHHLNNKALQHKKNLILKRMPNAVLP